jgi:cyclopropane fatty-acyl-phospholipid synthase-like methyltransferase
VSIYLDKAYLTQPRLLAYLEQFKYVDDGDNVLEIGSGAGIFGELAKRVARYESIDIDSETGPDHVADIAQWEQISHLTGRFDRAFCCQVLEHMPYDVSMRALKNLFRLRAKRLVVSVPDNRKVVQLSYQFRRWSWQKILSVPFTGTDINITNNEQHHWEIWHRNHDAVISDFTVVPEDYRLLKHYRFYHRFKQHFFVYELKE